jgi:hypothetical protein
MWARHVGGDGCSARIQPCARGASTLCEAATGDPHLLQRCCELEAVKHCRGVEDWVTAAHRLYSRYHARTVYLATDLPWETLEPKLRELSLPQLEWWVLPVNTADGVLESAATLELLWHADMLVRAHPSLRCEPHPARYY